MLHRALIALLFLAGQYGLAQDFDYNRDYKNLLQLSRDASDAYYYPILLSRFEKCDSTLTNKEVMALMIGFTGSGNYDAYGNIGAEREIMALISDKRYEDALVKCRTLLQTNPLNFVALMEQGFAYSKLNMDSAGFQREKFMKVWRAIQWSGDGTRDKPIFVLSPIDGQPIITHLLGGRIGSMGSSSDQYGNFLDMLIWIKKDGSSAPMYFIIQHAMAKMELELNAIADSLESNKVKPAKNKKK